MILDVNTQMDYNIGMELRAALGNAIRRLRENAGMTQADLSERTGIQRPNISRIERGGQMPGADILLQLARALDVTPDEIYRAAGHVVMETGDGYQTRTPLTQLLIVASELDEQYQQVLLDVAEVFKSRFGTKNG